MAVRIRNDGKILCAAIHKAEPGDLYIDDSLHYYLSVEQKLLVTEHWKDHKTRGEWWWHNNVPEGIVIREYYLTKEL